MTWLAESIQIIYEDQIYELYVFFVVAHFASLTFILFLVLSLQSLRNEVYELRRDKNHSAKISR